MRDAIGNLMLDGDQITEVKNLNVEGAGQNPQRATLIKSIRLTGNLQERSTAASRA